MAAEPARITYRHRLPIRLMHWVNVLALLMLLASGLQIFNAHPALYWGDRSDPDRAWLRLSAQIAPAGEARGVTQVLGHRFDTTGLLGLSRNNGEWDARGFPSWATLPGPQWLALGRRWHFFFAWLLVINAAVYVAYSLYSRHLVRDILPSPQDLRGLGASVRDHLRLRHPRGAAAARYNPLQKLSYTLVIFGLGTLIVLTGLSMSPWIDATVSLQALVGGRQSARSLHFLAAFCLLAFAFVHIVMVMLTGPLNNLRSMITGRYRIQDNGESDHESESN
jgi:thiosulfate reductase cytochrome b subunit